MTVNWLALLNVAVVTLVATVVAVSLVAAAAYCLDTAHERKLAGQAAGGLRAVSFTLFGLVGFGVLFALWLIIPYFH